MAKNDAHTAFAGQGALRHPAGGFVQCGFVHITRYGDFLAANGEDAQAPACCDELLRFGLLRCGGFGRDRRRLFRLHLHAPGHIRRGAGAMIPGVLKVYRGQNEMIISIMMNYIATLFMGVLFTNWLRDGSVPQTVAVPDGTRLTRLFGLRATSAFVIAVAVSLIVYYFLFNTSKGFQLRAVGFNMTAAKFNGFAVEKYFLFSFLISGMIAGLGGSAEILGTQFFLINGYAAGYGFDGVSMALIGQLHPIATMLVAIFFAALRVGSTTMQAATGVPTSVSDIIQALVIVFTVAGLALVKLPEFKAFTDRVFAKKKEVA